MKIDGRGVGMQSNLFYSLLWNKFTILQATATLFSL